MTAERGNQVPLEISADVAVAGAGIAGVFAAIAAGRAGARTLLIERFGELGGNIGPGMIWGGGLHNEADYTLPGGMAAIPKEFIERLEALLGETARNCPNIAGRSSFLLHEMTREADVELMLSAFAGDPIAEDGVVSGLWVETRSGRVRVSAGVTVDATGEASLAARAGAPIIRHVPPKPSYAPIVRPNYLDERYQKYNEAGLVAIVAGADFPACEQFLADAAGLDDDDCDWARRRGIGPHGPIVGVLRRAAEAGEFDPWRELMPNVHLVTSAAVKGFDKGLGWIRLQARGELDIDDWRQVSVLESEMRAAAHEYLDLLRRRVPGFKKAYIVCMSPFLGTRGGPCIDAEHVLTPEEAIKGSRHDDVLFVNIHEAVHGGAEEGYDFPYRSLLPKGIDGLLVTGRGAGYERRAHDPSGIRARPSMMIIGQVTGEAAALAVARNESARRLDVHALQAVLVGRGIHLGDAARLAQLGLG